MAIRAVIFDMDGVLWQSGPVHEQAYRQVLALEGLQDVPYSTIAGQRTTDVMRSLLREQASEVDEARIARMSQAKSALALERLRLLNPVTPGALEVLERLSSYLPVALATSGSRASAEVLVENNQLGPLFSAIVTGADVARAKPAPDIFLAAAQRLGQRPEDCLVVEDSVSGIEAALQAGCQVAALTTEPSDRSGVHHVISSLAEIIPITGGSERRIWEKAGEPPASAVHPEKWTVMIPAAGKGTRLGFDLPKTLFPVAGRPILDWLLDLFAPRVSSVIVVASPSGRAPIEERLKSHQGNFHVVEQPEPLGMGHAVGCGLPQVATSQVMIVWGDQPALREETIDTCMRLHESFAPLATVPTLWRPRPYIHFRRNREDGLDEILQAREGDAMPEVGESDAGLFCFRSSALRRVLQDAAAASRLRGRKTGEINLLPALACLDTLPGNVLSARVATEQESVGVNTAAEAELLGDILRARGMPARTSV